MKKNVLILIIIINSIASCNSRTSKEEIATNKTKQYQDKLYERYIPLMNKLLKDNNYNYPSNEDFKSKISDYFGINIDASNYNDVDLQNGPIAINSERFIDTYSLDRGDIDGAGDAFSEILKEGIENEFNKDFLYYNKILFYDDLATISKISNDTSRLENVVIYFNYEKNDLLNKGLIRNIKNISDFNDDFKFHLLWYNNKSKSDIIRKKILSDICIKNTDFIIDLSYFLFKKRQESRASDELFNETLAYLLDLVLKSKNDEATETNMAFRALNNFYEDDHNLINKLKIYNFQFLEKYTKIYQTLKIEEEPSYFGVIKDTDGYTNLRKEKSSKSEIIQKIKTGSRVEILNHLGDWWLIKTNENNRGYVFKTNIKQE